MLAQNAIPVRTAEFELQMAAVQLSQRRNREVEIDLAQLVRAVQAAQQQAAQQQSAPQQSKPQSSTQGGQEAAPQGEQQSCQTCQRSSVGCVEVPPVYPQSVTPPVPTPDWSEIERLRREMVELKQQNDRGRAELRDATEALRALRALAEDQSGAVQATPENAAGGVD